MERRLALATAAAAAATFGIGTVCFAALGGSNILGMTDGVQSIAPATPQTVTRVVVVVGPDGSVTGTSLVVETVPVDASDIAATDPAAPPAPPVVVPPAFAPTIATTIASAVVTTAKPSPARPVTTVTVHTTAPAPATTHATTPAPATTAATTPPTTAKPVVTTTTAAAPASTLPAGVPANWPPGKPIPPKPANCKNGQLEDNGVWNCEH